MTVTLNFHGAAGTVTGSCYRIVHPHGQFLVDCGLFQGNRSVRDLNLKPLPFDPRRIDFVLLTHAHIDHAGLLPKLYKLGYRNTMLMTEPTAGLLEFLLPDAAGIQESEAERETKKRGRRGDAPAEPLYTMKDATEALKHRATVKYGEWIAPGSGVRARYWNAGHILGSASIEVEVENGDGQIIRLLFSGDIGPDEKVFYLEPDAPAGFDYILCESTYGGRERDDYTLVQRRDALKTETLSITTGQPQMLVLDEKDRAMMKGKNVALVDDVISTGSTLQGMRMLMGKADAKVVVEAAILTEGDRAQWERIHSLGHLPLFSGE